MDPCHGGRKLNKINAFSAWFRFSIGAKHLSFLGSCFHRKGVYSFVS